ncbi:hypothetical protein OTU49_006900 [Cherax quadricarinatus]|uniref:Uncharacterized protein n=1 Tax=Cherax quadricarinatus TaxID=27406 RepID=A0AAW0X0L8_CHEQU
MSSNLTFLSLLSLMVGYTFATDGSREGRQIFMQMTTYVFRESGRYQLCELDGTVGACMNQVECSRQRGLFAGYCGYTDDYCCFVDKTCGGRTSAHHAYFRNPSYPKNDTLARSCNFEIEIRKKVCAVRLDFNKFELAKYDDSVCIRDTFTVLGTSLNETTTPVCGNMTNWATTFAVKEKSVVTLAMVLQGIPAYLFSISITQLACQDIVPFQAPTVAGVMNPDAKKYIPTTTTEKPDPTTTDPTTDDTTITTDDTTITTEMMEDMTTVSSIAVEREVVSPDHEEPVPTTLKPGKLPTPSTEGVLIRAISHPESVEEEGDELESDEEEEEEEGIYLENYEVTPPISAFKQAFELKVNDKCWQYEEEADTGFRIIGGGYTRLNEFPWQVALVYRNKFFCGGSLISDRHILTAGHCVFGSFSRGIDLLRVSLGDHDLATRNETKNIVAKVKTVHWHLHYNPHTTVNDIALMELDEPIDFSYSISAVKLPSDLDERYDLANATVSGWGRYSSKVKKTSSVLKKFTGPLMNTTKCVAAWNKFPGVKALYDKHVCLDITMGTPCHGDSGGPLVVCSGVQCTQVGVVSFGFPLCINVGLPTVFTRITNYKSWIDMNLLQLNYV